MINAACVNSSHVFRVHVQTVSSDIHSLQLAENLTHHNTKNIYMFPGYIAISATNALTPFHAVGKTESRDQSSESWRALGLVHPFPIYSYRLPVVQTICSDDSCQQFTTHNMMHRCTNGITCCMSLREMHANLEPKPLPPLTSSLCGKRIFGERRHVRFKFFRPCCPSPGRRPLPSTQYPAVLLEYLAHPRRPHMQWVYGFKREC